MKSLSTLLLAAVLLAAVAQDSAANSEFFTDFINAFPSVKSLKVQPYTTGADYCKSYGVQCSGNAVEMLVIYDIPLVGATLPSSINKLTSAKEISFIGCSLKAKLSDFSSLGSTITSIRLPNNDISGAIPSLPSTLLTLELSGNSISALPASFPASLRSLYLENNKITAKLDDASKIFTLADMNELFIADNSFTGTIPADVRNSKKMEVLVARNCGFSGKLPDFGGDLYYKLDLSYNKFEGSLPQSLLTKPKMTYLSLRGNKLSGTLPSLSGLTTLMYLDLSENQFTGALPVISAKRLLVFNLSGNTVTGSISDSTFANTQLGDGECLMSSTSLTGKSSICKLEGNGPTPVEPTPVEPTPVEPTPVEPTPVEPTPVEPTPVEPTPTEPTPSSGTSFSGLGPYSAFIKLLVYASVVASIHVSV